LPLKSAKELKFVPPISVTLYLNIYEIMDGWTGWMDGWMDG
jgi:hypothetical protein